ncbi:hypothetical protein HPB58_19390 [Priestia filamentosa]|uniref:hypothetical protein n=1 Tax=Priestia filamentosa TaxID=1402861 RepID=UPI001FB1E763|nr:hypothetical protein [Priestia filamentosa]MED3727159.1 hypothetical protein [Priestia filamentosa]UOE59466.1 hypothetical protein HPB58_19390 [Priestia filamentosa]
MEQRAYLSLQTLFLKSASKLLQESPLLEVKEYYEKLKAMVPYRQIQYMFEKIPFLHGEVHGEMIKILTSSFGYAVKERALTFLEDIKFVPNRRPYVLCGPQTYELNEAGEFAVTADLSVTCYPHDTVFFVSLSATQYDLISHATLKMKDQDIQSQIHAQKEPRNRIS